MNFLWVFENEISEKDRVEITDSVRLEHLHNILKSKENDELKVVLLNQGIGKAKINSLSTEKVQLEIQNSNEGEKRSIKVLVGLSRPQTMKKVLELASSFPVSDLYFHRSELGEKSYETSKILEANQIEKHLLLGLSQVGRFHTLPNIHISKHIPFNSIKDIETKIIFHPGSSKSLKDFPHNDIVLAFGSERGYTKAELALFEENNFQKAWLSPSILRVETALTSALSGLDLLSF
ncbi:MAG: RsmE family RNA methyltransferase [Bacteriovoracaceae bacterium]|nr:RsmE family RNA methyltransferase [Bacteriovoracaceae bacterium]